MWFGVLLAKGPQPKLSGGGVEIIFRKSSRSLLIPLLGNTNCTLPNGSRTRDWISDSISSTLGAKTCRSKDGVRSGTLAKNSAALSATLMRSPNCIISDWLDINVASSGLRPASSNCPRAFFHAFALASILWTRSERPASREARSSISSFQRFSNARTVVFFCETSASSKRIRSLN
jgi:hypothetical protein